MHTRIPVFARRCAAREAVALALGVFLALPAGLVAGDALTQLSSFSLFSEVDLPKLLQGEVLTERGPITDFRRGISGQSCYVVRCAPAEVAAYIRTASPSITNRTDSIYFHAKIDDPARSDALAGIALDLPKSDVRRLVDRTMAVTAKSTDFCMSRTEATRAEAQILDGKAKGMASDAIAKQVWTELLLGRLREFQEKGLGQVSPYDMERTPVSPSDEMRRLLEEEPEIQTQFQELLEETGLLPSKKETRRKSAGYAELMDAQIVATFDLGAVFEKPLPNGEFQVLDAQYYSSNAYYVMLTLFHLWPIQTEGGTATLVWRGDFLSAPLLDVTRGTARMAWGLVMMREIKQSIQNFQAKILKTP